MTRGTRKRARSRAFINMSNFDTLDDQVTADKRFAGAFRKVRIRSQSAHSQTMQVGFDPINKSYTREQHRLADYFEHQDMFYKFSTWPAWLQDDMLACPKTFQQRTDCFLHFVRNGVYGATARNWILACDVIDGKLIWSTAYPEDVRMDMARLVKKAIAGELVNDKANTYHHQTGQVIKGLNPAEWPTFQQLRALRAPARAESRPGPERTERQPRAQVYYPPQQAGRQERLTSGIRYLRGIHGYVISYLGRDYRLNIPQ